MHSSAQLAGQECFPKKENKLVYDVADVLSSGEERELEQHIIRIADSTSNQITIVIVPDLCGMDKAQFAIELGELWGVGQTKEDNGIVMLIKPKTKTSKGEMFIAVGRGLEGVIPDITAKGIVDNECVPSFKQNDYYQGILKG
ncbi:MAG: TPM domain-containing protein, partial [Flavobacteriales bacterium]